MATLSFKVFSLIRKPHPIGSLAFCLLAMNLILVTCWPQIVSANTQNTLSKILQSEGERAAVEFLEERVADDDIAAIHLLVKYYVQKRSAKEKWSEIVSLLERGAELNDVRSLYLLGNIYSDGHFTQPNIQLAREYYGKAAKAGHQKAATKLAQLPALPQLPDNFTPPQSSQEPPTKPPKNTEPAASPPTVTAPQQEPKTDPKPKFPQGYSSQEVSWAADRLDRYKITGFGSGFALSSEGVIATNEHVINGCKEVYAVYQGKPKRARLLFANKEHDFAVLKIPNKTPSFFFLKGSVPVLGEALTSGGYPSPRTLGAGIKITTGVVSSEESQTGSLFQHTTPSQPGNSGGPLINDAGYVVGISTSVYGEKIGELSPQNINFAVSQKTIQFNLKKWNLPFSKADDKVIFRTTLLADMLKKSTAQIICY